MTTYTSRVNGLTIPISGDMKFATKFFASEEASQIIDDGQTQIRTTDTDQANAEIKRLQQRIADMEAQAAAAPIVAPKEKPIKASVKQLPVPDAVAEADLG
jgi:phage shock protein A